ncbi:MAG: transcription termination/antitermination protein NusG [Acidobacteriaceae bacterium]
MADELRDDEQQTVPTGAGEALASDVAADAETAVAGVAVGGAGSDEEPETAAAPQTQLKWYIIHAYSGFERKVKESLLSRVAAYHLEDKVGRIEIPTEPTTEIRNGKKYTIDRVFLPGYVFVELALDNDMWHVVKNTPRVTGFLQTGDQPNALSEEEVNAMLNRSDVTREKPKLKLKFAKGELVRITDGPFNNFNGAVDDVNEDKQTLKVMVSIFGRPTPTEVSFANVEKVEG